MTHAQCDAAKRVSLFLATERGLTWPPDIPNMGSTDNNLHPWSECDLFCIEGHGDVTGQACGWRGKLLEAGWDRDRQLRTCPRCGGATLMRVPTDTAFLRKLKE